MSNKHVLIDVFIIYCFSMFYHESLCNKSRNNNIGSSTRENLQRCVSKLFIQTNVLYTLATVALTEAGGEEGARLTFKCFLNDFKIL